MKKVMNIKLNHSWFKKTYKMKVIMVIKGIGKIDKINNFLNKKLFQKAIASSILYFEVK